MSDISPPDIVERSSSERVFTFRVLIILVYCVLFFPGIAAAVAPANDNFANSTPIAGASGTIVGTNVDATKETSEPDHAGEPGGKSVWWTWVAPASEVVSIDTFGSDFDTVLAVYTGASVDSLIPVSANDDVGDLLQSNVSFNATGGTTYHIVVDGFDGDFGAIVLNWGAAVIPVNDNFAEATSIIGKTGKTTGTNVSASKEINEPNHAGNPGGHSVWWNWTAPASGEVSIDTFGSDFDTVFAVYTGLSVDLLTLVAENDDADETFQSSVTFKAVAGVTYHIAVDGFEGEIGTVELNWIQTFSNDVVANLPGVGVKVLMNDNTSSVVLHTDMAEALATADVDNNGIDDVFVSFPAGTGPNGNGGTYISRNQSALVLLDLKTAEQIVAGNFDGKLGDDLLIDFGAGGLATYMNDTAISPLASKSPMTMAVGDVDNNGQDDVVLSFASVGTLVFKNFSVVQFLDTSPAETLAVGDIDGNGEDDIAASFPSGTGPGGTGGLFIARNQGPLTLLVNLQAKQMVSGDFDGTGKDDFVFDFGGTTGLYIYLNDASAKFLTTLSISAMTTGDVDSSDKDDLIISLSGIGIVAFKNLTTVEIWDPTAAITLATGNLDGN